MNGGGIIVPSPHCTKGVNTRVLMHANTTELKHSDGGNMDGENYIAQLTEEERAGLAVEIGKASLHTLSRHRDQTWTPDGVNCRARKIIEARKPELGLDGCERLRWYMGVIDGMLDREWIYFPTEESRDEGFRRAKRAAMEYSLWAQLYPNGFMIEGDARVYVIDGSDNVVSGGWAYGARIFDGKTCCVYATKADAQRVAEILKREGV